MKYVLDTDTITYFRKGDKNVVEKLTNVPPELLHTTIINHSELFFGAFYSKKKKQNLLEVEELLSCITILDFCENSSQVFAEQKAILRKSGKIIQDMDLMIASIVIHNDMTLVTNNTKHFQRIKELKLENWL